MLENRGRGVNAYVMDTGVRITHETFQGRASNFMGQTITPYCSGSQSMNDIDGHGTAVASILAGSGGFGISFANIINVKIWCQRRAAISSMAKAISDITAEHQTNVRQRPSWFKGSIINLSSQTLTFSPTLRDAVAAASDAGIAVLVSAGNDGQPAYAGGHLCRLPTTICVTSCDSDYSLSSFANHGVAVDIIAPGGDVPVATPEDDESVGGIRGTSFAVPIVGGVLATFIGNEDLITDLRTTRQRLFDNALRDVIGLEARSTTPNLLVNIPTNRLIWPSGLPYVGAPASSRQCSSFPGCLRPS
ncbi:subtilisin-like protein [Viridothelium virens]|uniref:Subtilisin-like protein n=1 Tax=Viridothelium virens TaxID=1048519 RepID=A0A6A6HJ62_VIRVR|nr:subtilisin-like protein [Viridothelium virens]